MDVARGVSFARSHQCNCKFNLKTFIVAEARVVVFSLMPVKVKPDMTGSKLMYLCRFVLQFKGFSFPREE